MSTIVIMPGGFHPFHAGHFALYQSALKAFPGADVYVAATNDMSERPFPFALKEKLAKLAGVKPGHFIQVKSPFQAKEITQNYNPEQDVLIFVRSEKDRNESPKPGGTKKDGSPAYFQPWTGKDVQPFAKHAYFAYLPTVEFGPGITSATQIRKAWPTLNDKRKTAMVMSLYPAVQKNPKLAQTVVGMFDQVMGGPEQLAEASYMSVDDYKNNLQKALPSIIEYYQDELGFTPSKEQLASAVKAAHATMQRTGDTEQAGESLEAVLDSFVPSNSSNKNLPKIDFKKNLLQVLQQKYPDAEFKIGPDRVESTDGQLSVIADTEQEGKYVGCFMWDVSTGPYKGALGLAVKQTTDQLLQANPGKKPALFISGDNQNPEAWSYIAKKLKYKLITDEDELEEGSLNEFAVDGFGDNGDHRSKLLASVGRLFDAGNKVDWQVPGQMGHVTRVQDDGITMKKWKKPHSRMSFFLPMTDDSRDKNYTIKMVAPKHYTVVSADPSWNLEEGSEEALQYATKAHAGQTRAGGDPYITHPMRVADHIKQYKQSHNLDALISAAYLHDTVEDTDTTHEALHDLFGGLVASLVKELTSDPEEIKKVGKAQYLAHKMAAMSSYALVIKLADRLDNVKDITTARTPQWRQKYKNETEHILNYIEKTRALSGTHQKLIGLIRDKLSELDNPPEQTESFGINYPGTYEQENNMYKGHGQRRTGDLTNETSLSESADYLEEK